MRCFLCILWLCLCCLVTPAAAWATEAWLVPQSEDHIPLSDQMTYAIVEPDVALGDIPDSAWQRNAGRGLNLGFSQQAIWVRIDLTFDQDDYNEWFLNLNNGNIRELLYLHYRDDQVQKQVSTGVGQPFASRQVAYRNFVFRFAATPEHHTIYLRLKTNNVISLTPVLSKRQAWFVRINKEQALTGAIFGVLAILAIYNLAISAFSRDATFLMLAIALFGGLLWRAVDTGVALQLLYPNTPAWQEYVIRGSLFLYLGGAVLFTRNLLKISQWSPALSNIHLLMAAVLGSVMLVPVFRAAPGIGLLVIACCGLLCAVSTLLALRQEIDAAKTYAVGVGMFVFSIVIVQLSAGGLFIETFLIEYAQDLGMVALGLLSSVALASRLAEDRLQREVAVAEAASKSEFLANMSHELRTPLNAIIGFSQLIGEKKLDEDLREPVEKIQTASHHLLRLINDILDFSKIEAGKLDTEQLPVSPIELVENTVSVFSESAGSKGLKLCVAPTPPDLWFEGDPTRLMQVLFNLVSNAIKFTDRGEVSIGAAVEGGLVTFTVTDSGIGMTAAQQASVLRPFTQADASTTRRYGGTGLGLSICTQLADIMGGRLSIDSTPGEGSTFSFSLPFKAISAPSASAAPSDPEPLDATDLRILVVEDNKVNQLLVKRMLENMDAACDVVENGEEAISALAGGPYDLVFMDCQMPVLDGYAATRKIRDELQMDLPIIAMTANALEGDREKCLDAGMSDYMTKPIRLQDVRQRLQRWAEAP